MSSKKDTMEKENHNGHVTVYNEKHDAYYCKTCDEWLEDICTDRSCAHCNGRPLRPSELSPTARLTDKDNELSNL